MLKIKVLLGMCPIIKFCRLLGSQATLWFSPFEMWTPRFGFKDKLEFQVANNEIYIYNMIS